MIIVMVVNENDTLLSFIDVNLTRRRKRRQSGEAFMLASEEKEEGGETFASISRSSSFDITWHMRQEETCEEVCEVERCDVGGGRECE